MSKVIQYYNDTWFVRRIRLESIKNNPKPTIYRNLPENAGPEGDVAVCNDHSQVLLISDLHSIKLCPSLAYMYTKVA